MSGRRQKWLAGLTADLVRAGKPATLAIMKRWWRRLPAPGRAYYARVLAPEKRFGRAGGGSSIILPERLAGRGRGFRWR